MCLHFLQHFQVQRYYELVQELRHSLQVASPIEAMPPPDVEEELEKCEKYQLVFLQSLELGKVSAVKMLTPECLHSPMGGCLKLQRLKMQFPEPDACQMAFAHQDHALPRLVARLLLEPKMATLTACQADSETAWAYAEDVDRILAAQPDRAISLMTVPKLVLIPGAEHTSEHLTSAEASSCEYCLVRIAHC